MTKDKFIDYALAEGFYSAAVIDTKDIVFDPSFRPYCEEDIIYDNELLLKGLRLIYEKNR